MDAKASIPFERLRGADVAMNYLEAVGIKITPGQREAAGQTAFHANLENYLATQKGEI